MRALVALTLVALLAAGCVDGCPPKTEATFWQMDLYAALEGRDGVKTSRPAAGLEFADPVPSERWPGSQLRQVRFFPNETWERRGPADPVYAAQLWLVGPLADRAALPLAVQPGTRIVLEAHASVPEARLRDHVAAFLETTGQSAPTSAWMDALFATKQQTQQARLPDGTSTTSYGYQQPWTPAPVVHDAERWEWNEVFDWDTPGNGIGILFWNEIQYTFEIPIRSVTLRHDGHEARFHVAADGHVRTEAPEDLAGTHQRYADWLTALFDAKGLPPAQLGRLELSTTVC